MPPPEPFRIFTRKLNELGLRYMVSGSVAAIFYGEPRLTNDVDIIVYLKRDDLPRVEKAFPPDEFYCPPLDVMRMEVARDQRGHFNLIHHDTGFKADIYVSGSDQLHVWGLANARAIDVEGDVVQLAPPEYVIIRKLQYFREGSSPKHLRDIHRMLQGLGDLWDRSQLDAMIRDHTLQAEWEKVAAMGAD
jgi:hypothetical protein